MPNNTQVEHNTQTEQVAAQIDVTDGVSPSEGQTEHTPSFKDKLSQFAYKGDSTRTMPATLNSRVLRSANPKVSFPVARKVSKPISSRSSSQAPSEDATVSEDVKVVKAVKAISPSAPIQRGTKRKSDAMAATAKTTTPVSKKARTKKSTSSSATTSAPLVNNLKDSVRPGLILISVGVNPGKLTGQLGHPYSHKSNKYWPGLHAAGITPIRHQPTDAPSLMSLYGLGHTNIVPDIATESESGLTTQQFLDGAAKLDAKIRALKPEAVMLLGRGIWYRWMQYKTGKIFNPKRDGPLEMGLQDEEFWVGREVVDGKVVWKGAVTFVLESPSGQAAISNEARLKSWSVVGEWFKPKREKWVEERERERDASSRHIDE